MMAGCADVRDLLSLYLEGELDFLFVAPERLAVPGGEMRKVCPELLRLELLHPALEVVDEGQRGFLFRGARAAGGDEHGEALVLHGEAVEPVLHHHRHFLGIAGAQPVGQLRLGMAGVEGDEEMVLPGKPVLGDIGQNLLDQAAHGAVHQVSVVD